MSVPSIPPGGGRGLSKISCSYRVDQLGRRTTGSFTAVACVSDIVPPGVTFTYFLYPGSPADAVTAGDTNLHPINLRYPFKLGKGRLKKIGTTGLADVMTFVPRNLVPQT